jgi:hypothetical protein
MTMAIEVTVFVPFTHEGRGGLLIEGTAEIYGGDSDYDMVKAVDKFGLRLRGELERAVRDELIGAQYVYDTVREAISMEYDAR